MKSEPKLRLRRFSLEECVVQGEQCVNNSFAAWRSTVVTHRSPISQEASQLVGSHRTNLVNINRSSRAPTADRSLVLYKVKFWLAVPSHVLIKPLLPRRRQRFLDRR